VNEDGIFIKELTEEEARALIEHELKRIAGGDEMKLWRLRKFQNKIDKELAKYVDPIARYNKMVEIFFIGLEEFRASISSK
jgi:hypothetical protein